MSLLASRLELPRYVRRHRQLPLLLRLVGEELPLPALAPIDLLHPLSDAHGGPAVLALRTALAAGDAIPTVMNRLDDCAAGGELAPPALDAMRLLALRLGEEPCDWRLVSAFFLGLPPQRARRLLALAWPAIPATLSYALFFAGEWNAALACLTATRQATDDTLLAPLVPFIRGLVRIEDSIEAAAALTLEALRMDAHGGLGVGAAVVCRFLMHLAGDPSADEFLWSRILRGCTLPECCVVNVTVAFALAAEGDLDTAERALATAGRAWPAAARARTRELAADLLAAHLPDGDARLRNFAVSMMTWEPPR